MINNNFISYIEKIAVEKKDKERWAKRYSYNQIQNWLQEKNLSIDDDVIDFIYNNGFKFLIIEDTSNILIPYIDIVGKKNADLTNYKRVHIGSIYGCSPLGIEQIYNHKENLSWIVFPDDFIDIYKRWCNFDVLKDYLCLFGLNAMYDAEICINANKNSDKYGSILLAYFGEPDKKKAIFIELATNFSDFIDQCNIEEKHIKKSFWKKWF